MRTSPKRWLREPLLHFLVIGVLLFAAYRMLHPEVSRTAEVNRIELTEDDLRQLEVGWTAQWRRPPTSEEMQRLVDGRIREEILARSNRLGLWALPSSTSSARDPAGLSTNRLCNEGIPL